MQKLNTDNISKLLIIYPHPDDEAFFGSGLIRKLILEDKKVRLITLTRGEATTLRYGLKRGADIATERAREMHKALQVLGITSHGQYDLKDGELDKSKAAKIVEEEIKRFRPSHALTFEPGGIYGHPDHVLTTKLIEEAIRNRGVSLIYATLPRKVRKRFSGHFAQKLKVFSPIKPTHYLPLEYELLRAKIGALAAHKSQVKLGPKFFWKWGVRGNLLREYYYC